MTSRTATPVRRSRGPGPLARVAADARIAWAVALLLAAALGVASVLFAPLVVAERDHEAVREVAAAMATRLTTFSADDLDAWARDVAALATDEYADEVGTLLDESVRADLAAAGVTSRGELTDLYVQRLDGAAAGVFAVVRQTTRSGASGEPVTSSVRMTMTLRRAAGSWQVGGVSVLADAGRGLAGPGSG